MYRLFPRNQTQRRSAEVGSDKYLVKININGKQTQQGKENTLEKISSYNLKKNTKKNFI